MIESYELLWMTVLAGCAALALAAGAYARPRLALGSSYLLVAIAGTKFRVREADYAVRVAADWQILLELALYGGVALLVIMSFVSGRIPRRRLAPQELLLVSFAALALSSTLWSGAPSLTAVRSVQMLIVCGLALASVRLLGPGESLRVASAALVGYVLVFSGISTILGMGYNLFDERSFRFTWFAVHPLLAAVWAAEATLLVLARHLFGEYLGPLRQRKVGQIFSWTVLLSLFAVLVLTNSRGPLLAFLAAAGLMVWKVMRAGMARGLVATTTVLVLSLALFGESISNDSMSVSDSLESAQGQQGLIAERIFRGGNMESLRGLNGRVEVWKAAAPLIAEEPLLGYGYQGSRELMFSRISWASQAHNAYVQTLLDFGIIGAFLVWGVFASIFIKLISRPFGAVTGVAWCDASMTGIAAFLLVSSISSESLIASPGYEALLLFLLASVIGQYKSPALQAFHRSSTTRAHGLLAHQDGRRAYRHP